MPTRPHASLALASVLGFALALAVAADPPAPTPAPAPADAAYAKQMAGEHKHDAPAPSPVATERPKGMILWEEIPYTKVNGRDVIGKMVRRMAPNQEDWPTVIAIHEWWGLNKNISQTAALLADRNFIVFTVDLYGGKTANDPKAAEEMMTKAMADPKAALDNLQKAYAYLHERFPKTKTGVVGWCFGGGWSLQTALEIPDGIRACVMYYGRPEPDLKRLARLKAPLLGFFGGKDKTFTPEVVHAFEGNLKKLGKAETIEIYPDADHAFANPSGGNYNAAAAKDSWTKMINFFAQYLHPDSATPAKSAAAPGG